MGVLASHEVDVLDAQRHCLSNTQPGKCGQKDSRPHSLPKSCAKDPMLSVAVYAPAPR